MNVRRELPTFVHAGCGAIVAYDIGIAPIHPEATHQCGCSEWRYAKGKLRARRNDAWEKPARGEAYRPRAEDICHLRRPRERHLWGPWKWTARGGLRLRVCRRPRCGWAQVRQSPALLEAAKRRKS